MSVYAVPLSLATFMSTLLAGLVVIRYRARLAMVTAFAAGVLIAVPLFDLLPESLKLSSETSGIGWPIQHGGGAGPPMSDRSRQAQ